jgi:serine/threonine protein kinase
MQFSFRSTDFGLAKELKEDNKAATGKYRLSGNTGSLAYMAPEVAKGWKYDKTVDVYSFGILLWEIASLRPAFESYSKEEDMHRVWNGDERPPIENWWPLELQWLLKKCWAYFAKSRPEFDLVKETLQEIIYSSDDEEEEQIRNIQSFRFGSRRSQKLSGSSQNSREAPRRATTRPAEFQHVPPKQQKGKFLGIF